MDRHWRSPGVIKHQQEDVGLMVSELRTTIQILDWDLKEVQIRHQAYISVEIFDLIL